MVSFYNASISILVSCQLSVVSCSLSVGHLEDKLSVIAKNSSPNASPVQLSVVSCQLSVVKLSPITNYQLPNY
ncbi:MAG: hypothetical protein LW859_05160 [Anabaena sp. 49633_E8]|nr:hypothetical protein [Anabaena sp. 49633_E8]